MNKPTAATFTTGIEPYRGTTKHSQWAVELFGLGGVFGIVSWLIPAPAKDWVGGISLLAPAAGLLVFLLGVVAERKHLESQHKNNLK